MSRHRRSLLAPAVAAASVVVLAGCASAAGDGGGADTAGFALPAPNPPAGEVIAQGTVFDTDGDAELCLGAIAESYPPQCAGALLPLAGWTWDGLDGFETAAQVTWGAYAVPGRYDGTVFRVSGTPIMLALYDPMMPEDPTGGVSGAGEQAELERLQSELPDRLGEDYLGGSVSDGRLWVDVVWDDGTWQDAADDEFGPGVVIVRSALRAPAP